MLFKTLAAFLPSKSDTITLTICHEDAKGPEGSPRYRVNLIPKTGTLNEEAKALLEKPLSIVGTLDELDGQDFISGITSLSASRQSVKDVFAEAEEANKKAASEKKSSAHRPVKSVTTYPKKDADKDKDKDKDKAPEPAAEPDPNADKTPEPPKEPAGPVADLGII